MSKVSFNNQNKTFFNSINARVENYFRERNLKKTGDKKLYLKSSILITGAIAMYVVLLTSSMNPVFAALLCCAFGFVQACIGFNVMHDANHGSYSRKKWVNYTMGLSANLLGANSWLWKQQHNIIHHTYTNIEGVDDDIHQAPLLRMCPYQKQLKMHRYQYLYCLPLYGLSSLARVFLTDFSKYFSGKIQMMQLRGMQTREHFIFWISKAVYLFLYLALPIYIVGFFPALIGFLLMHITLGLTLSSVFQLAHAVEDTHFADAHQNSLKIEEEWAIHQVLTTADFATNNKFILWFTGGLNFQVEHHLFPKISHVHYPVIHKFVEEACRKYSIPLNNYPSMTAALLSHLRFVKQLGR